MFFLPAFCTRYWAPNGPWIEVRGGHPEVARERPLRRPSWLLAQRQRRVGVRRRDLDDAAVGQDRLHRLRRRGVQRADHADDVRVRRELRAPPGPRPAGSPGRPRPGRRACSPARCTSGWPGPPPGRPSGSCPGPRADRPPDSGATMPMTSVPLLVSQELPPPAPPVLSCRLVPHAVSPRAPARIAAVTIVRLRVMCQNVLPWRVYRIGGARPPPRHSPCRRAWRTLGDAPKRDASPPRPLYRTAIRLSPRVTKSDTASTIDSAA